MIRKILAAVILLAMTSPAHAALFGDDGVLAHYVSPSSIGTSTAAVIIDLSDTTNWPHKKNSYARILSASILTDQVAAGTSTIKLGVVTAVNASSGTVSWFLTQDNALNVSNTGRLTQRDFTRFYADLTETSIPRSFITNDQTTTASAERTLFQTDITLPSTSGSFVAPSVGDIVAIIFGATSAPKVYIDVEYVTP